MKISQKIRDEHGARSTAMNTEFDASVHCRVFASHLGHARVGITVNAGNAQVGRR
ncbi:hypothetical protein [Kitasatospora sp. NPDC001132]